MGQRYVYKIHSSRLRKTGWNLQLPIDEARRNDEVISLADSQMLRWIDELNGIHDSDERARKIRREIKKIKKEDNSVNNKRKIRQLYKELDAIQFKPDYMCLIIDKKADYIRACKGFSINGVKYERLLGTNGGIKNSTIVFVSKRLRPELDARVNNFRDPEAMLVTAKLEAYKALTCSAAVPVSYPNGIIVVNDAETRFTSDIIYLTDEDVDEPVAEEIKDYEVVMNASDGFGLMLPSLAKRWSEELGLNYVVSGVNTRFSFEKGMVFAFDFLDFADNVAHSYEVIDAWGNKKNIRDAELILTTSMVKLWDSYASFEDYWVASLISGYTFGIAKSTPEELESERNLNYQFIQSYDLDDDDIDELVAPTIQQIKDVLGGDWRKTIVYLKGIGLDENNVDNLPNDIAKAIMVDRRVLHDPFVQQSIHQMIKKSIDDAKVGVIKVHGNYSIVSGDPYLLCQSMFGLELTGLLRAGEIYNKYWLNEGSKELACFRAPMTCHNNILRMRVSEDEKSMYWFKYMDTCTIFNAWDTSTAAMNGMDKILSLV